MGRLRLLHSEISERTHPPTPAPCLTASGLLLRARLGQVAKGSRVTKGSSKSQSCVCTGLQRERETSVQLSPPGGRLSLPVPCVEGGKTPQKSSSLLPLPQGLNHLTWEVLACVYLQFLIYRLKILQSFSNSVLINSQDIHREQNILLV